MPATAPSAAPPWPERWRHLLAALRRVPDGPARERLFDALLHPAGPRVLAFANAHAFNLAARDAAFFEDLVAADWLLRDGQGMAWLLRLMGQAPGLNLNGTDLIPALVTRLGKAQPGARIALLGTRAPWLARAGTRMQALAGGTRCLIADGFLPDDEYLRLARSESPHLVVLAMVNPGAEIMADGHIHVYAPLRGKAIAGAKGDATARIFTMSLEAELVSIAGVYRTSDTDLPADVRGKAAQVWLAEDKLHMRAL